MRVLKHTLALTLIYTWIWLTCFETPIHNPQKFFECLGGILLGGLLGALILTPPKPKERNPRSLRWQFDNNNCAERK